MVLARRVYVRGASSTNWRSCLASSLPRLKTKASLRNVSLCLCHSVCAFSFLSSMNNNLCTPTSQHGGAMGWGEGFFALLTIFQMRYTFLFDLLQLCFRIQVWFYEPPSSEFGKFQQRRSLRGPLNFTRVPLDFSDFR